MYLVVATAIASRREYAFLDLADGVGSYSNWRP